MILAEDEKFLNARRAATRGNLGLSVFTLCVLVSIWAALFWFLPQFLNPMHVFDGIQDHTLSADTVNFFAGLTVIFFHIIWLLFLVMVFAAARGLRREQRLVRIADQMTQKVVHATGESGNWKLQ